jgi:hypothetical protein
MKRARRVPRSAFHAELKIFGWKYLSRRREIRSARHMQTMETIDAKAGDHPGGDSGDPAGWRA